MRIGIVTGSLVATKKHPGFEAEKFLIVQPLDERRQPLGRELVANDIARAGEGDFVIFETGREAAMALEGKASENLSDATILAVVDSLDTG